MAVYVNGDATFLAGRSKSIIHFHVERASLLHGLSHAKSIAIKFKRLLPFVFFARIMQDGTRFAISFSET
jgi:hypothetical protein